MAVCLVCVFVSLVYLCPVRSAGLSKMSYLYIPDQVTWEEAAKRCEAEHQVLAQPETQAEGSQLVEFLIDNTPRTEDIWLGGYLDQSETWRWTTGAAITWSDWAVSSNQPNDLDEEKCIRIRRSDNKWWNRQCSKRFPFVCQMDSVREARFGVCGEDKVPTESPSVTYTVMSRPECTLRCLQYTGCKLYSVQGLAEDHYLCNLYISMPEEGRFRTQPNTRLYSRQS